MRTFITEEGKKVKIEVIDGNLKITTEDSTIKITRVAEMRDYLRRNGIPQGFLIESGITNKLIE